MSAKLSPFPTFDTDTALSHEVALVAHEDYRPVRTQLFPQVAQREAAMMERVEVVQGKDDGVGIAGRKTHVDSASSIFRDR